MPTLPRSSHIPGWIPRAADVRLAAGLWLVVLGLATPVGAQSATEPAATPDTVAVSAASLEALIQRVDQLEAEVRTLRSQLATRLTAESEPAPAAAPPAADAEAHAHTSAADGPEPKRTFPRTQVHWFSDVGFSLSDRTAATSSFGLGQLDLFLTSALNERWSVLSEIVFRANADNKFVVNPERLLLQFQPSDAVQVVMGRFHSSVGYYNVAYHHGSWFETAATRPSLFGAGLVPFHNVGVGTRARVPSGAANLEVVAELGNGLTSASRALEPTQNVVDENNHKATNLGVTTRPGGLPGLQAGVSWYRDRLRPAGFPSMAAHTMAAHVVYTAHGWELLNEIVAARHVDDGGSPARLSHGWYSQGAYRIGSFRPYVRYQAVQGDPADPIFGALGHRYGPVAGVRVDFGQFAALKVHVDRSHQSATGITSHDGVVKLAFTF